MARTLRTGDLGTWFADGAFRTCPRFRARAHSRRRSPYHLRPVRARPQRCHGSPARHTLGVGRTKPSRRIGARSQTPRASAEVAEPSGILCCLLPLDRVRRARSRRTFRSRSTRYRLCRRDRALTLKPIRHNSRSCDNRNRPHPYRCTASCLSSESPG
jgi:hypothetical protein